MRLCTWSSRCKHDAEWVVTISRPRRVAGTDRLVPSTRDLEPACGSHLAMVLSRHVSPGKAATISRA